MSNRTTILLSVRDTTFPVTVHFMSDGTCIVHTDKPSDDNTHVVTHISNLPSHFLGLTAVSWSNIPKRLVDKVPTSNNTTAYLYKVDVLPTHPILSFVFMPNGIGQADGKFRTLTEARTYYHQQSQAA